jgi:hypothetical protein
MPWLGMPLGLELGIGLPLGLELGIGLPLGLGLPLCFRFMRRPRSSTRVRVRFRFCVWDMVCV